MREAVQAVLEEEYNGVLILQVDQCDFIILLFYFRTLSFEL